MQPVAICYTRLDGIPLGRYWRPLFAWFGDLDLVPHLWQMVCLGETQAVVTFFPPVDIERLGDRKKLADYCYRQVSSGVQSANSGRPELLPSLAEPALGQGFIAAAARALRLAGRDVHESDQHTSGELARGNRAGPRRPACAAFSGSAHRGRLSRKAG